MLPQLQCKMQYLKLSVAVLCGETSEKQLFGIFIPVGTARE
jgi:hypothetical protein